MNKVLILDKNNATLRSLLQALQHYSDIEVIVASEREYVSRGLKQLPIDLVITDIEGTETCCFEFIEAINKQFPALPVDVLSAPLCSDMKAKMEKLRIARHFPKPIKAEETAKSIHQQLTNGAGGQLKGLSLTSVLQLINAERKTCVLSVRSATDSGELSINEGEIVAARTATMQGKDAAYNIVSWENVRIEFLENQPNVKQEIFEPFMALLMEALRLKDENQLPTPEANEVYKANDADPQQQTAPVTLMEKQILSMLDNFPGVVEYSLYDRNFELRFSKSGQQHPPSNFHTGFLSDKLQKVANMLEAGAFKYMTINEKNGLRHVFLNFHDFSINAGLRREQSIDHFLQQLNASFET
jgi:DNA-binding NarL/FixJ family response regulator